MLRGLLNSNNFYKYAAASLLLVIPLYPKFPFLKVPGTQVAIRIEDFLLAVIGLAILFNILPYFKKVISQGIERAMLLYISVGLISLISAILLTKTAIPHIGFLHLARRVEYFVPFFLGVLAIRKKENLNFFLNTLLLAIFIIFFYGLGQVYLNWPVIVTQNSEYAKGIALRWIPGGHLNSTFAGHYDLATFLVLVLPIFIAFFFTLKERFWRIAIALAIFSGLWLLLSSVSRISIVSYIAGVSIALLALRKFKELVVIVAVSLIFFSFSSDLRVRYLRIFDEIKKRMADSSWTVYAQQEVSERRTDLATPTPPPQSVVEDRSSSIRLNVEWPRAIRSLVKNPLLGTGYSSITLATDNDYLRALGETGILGLGAFALIFLNIGILFLPSVKSTLSNLSDIQRPFVAGLVGGVLGVLINAVFIDVFEASKFAVTFWLLIGILVGLIRNEKYTE